MKYQKLHNSKFAVALGLMCAVGAFLLGIIAISGYGASIVGAISLVYLGYSASISGAIIGALWAFVDGFIGGFIFAWIYNKIL